MILEIPTLLAYESEHNYQVWCIHCRKFHLHGKADGHRVAHCVCPLSPYQETGYFIERVGAWNERPQELRRVRRHRCNKTCFEPRKT